MKRISILLTLIAAILFTVGCSKKYAPEGALGNGAYSDGFTQYEADASFVDMSNLTGRTPGLPYDDTAVSKTMIRSAAKSSSAPREAADSSDSLSANFPNAERKLIKTATVRIRVENLSAADDAVTALLKKYDGYAASTNIEENSRFYSLRVPAKNYDVFLAETGSMGRLLNRYENTEDVTLRYYDLEGRLATKKELLRTFQSYLGKAKTIEEILSVEARLSELQYDIEGTGIQLRNLANQVDYATINLSLHGSVTSSPNRGLTFGERVKQLFGGFGGFLSTVAMILLGIVVYGIPILLLLGLLFVLLFGRIGLAKKLWRLIKS